MIKVIRQLSVPGIANPKYANLSFRENKKGWRIIGGDRADLCFEGFSVEGDRTVLTNPYLSRVLYEDFDYNQEAADDYAEDILMASFNSIGVETVEHS